MTAKKNTIPAELRPPNLIRPVWGALLVLDGSGTNEEIVTTFKE